MNKTIIITFFVIMHTQNSTCMERSDDQEMPLYRQNSTCMERNEHRAHIIDIRKQYEKLVRESLVNSSRSLQTMHKKIALIGEYNPELFSHQTTNAAIEHSNRKMGTFIKSEWISTDDISIPLLQGYAGIWITSGSCYKNLDKTLMAIKYAREHNVPCLGTCGGFQQIIIEYARNVLGHQDAQHEEYDPCSSNLFISSISCSLIGKELNLSFAPKSKIATFYDCCKATENSYCSFGINPQVVQFFKQGPLEIVGADSDNEIRAVEIESHPFFIGTLFVPQNQSTAKCPHVLITAFLKAIAQLT